MLTETLTGIFSADAPNNQDGSYPSKWHDFTIRTDSGMIVCVHASTGGVRDEFLKHNGQTAQIVASWPEGLNVAMGNSDTLVFPEI